MVQGPPSLDFGEARRIEARGRGLREDNSQAIFKACLKGQDWIEEVAYRAISIVAATALLGFERFGDEILTLPRLNRCYFITLSFRNSHSQGYLYAMSFRSQWSSLGHMFSTLTRANCLEE